MREAYHAASPLEAEAQLATLVREFARTHPSAAPSLREGLAEAFTVLRLGCTPPPEFQVFAGDVHPRRVTVTVERGQVAQVPLQPTGAKRPPEE